ncbi:MAG TPA: DUF2087 domain-containing protein [Actinomycetota bacterium]|nr:DUF2087 domain-containing protein [Actinomycetota bacterium]
MTPLPPLTVEVDCSGARHRLTWADGRLILDDHDLEAEEVATRLGGSAPYCLRVREAVAAPDLDLLALLGDPDTNPRRRGLEQQLTAPVHVPSPRFSASGVHRRAHVRSRALVEREQKLRDTWALPAPARHRIVMEKLIAGGADEGVVDVLRQMDAGERALDRDAFRAIARAIPKPPPPADDDERVLERFFEGDVLVEIPSNHTKRLLVLRRLLDDIAPGREYPEKELNEVLRVRHPDFAALRRYMVDEGLLARESGIYRRTDG